MTYSISEDNFAIPHLVGDANYYSGSGTDNSATLAAAINSGRHVRLPPGDFRIRSFAPHTFAGQKIQGAGQRQSRLHIASDFDGGPHDCFAKLLPGCAIEGLGFYFKQALGPGGSRNDLVQYPHAIKSDYANNTIIRDIMIMGGFYGISMRGDPNIGNCGTSIISDISLGAFYRGLWLSGVRDTVYATNIHHYPFGATDNDLFSPMLIGIFQDGGAEAIRCGLVEDLKVDNMLCSGSRIVFESQPSGPSSASLLNVTLDTSHAGLDIFDGTITATNLKKSRSVPDESIRVYGGNLIVSVFTLEGHEGTAAANPLVVVNGGNVSFDNGIVGLLGDNTNAFRLNGGELRVSNTRFDFGQNRVRPAPVIKVAGGRARICENTAKDGGSGAKNLIEVNNNERHCISDNDAPGWTTACIATGGTSSGIYRDNRT